MVDTTICNCKTVIDVAYNKGAAGNQAKLNFKTMPLSSQLAIS